VIAVQVVGIQEPDGDMSDLDEVREQYRRSVEAFIKGDPEPQKPLWSKRDDVTLANPFGPPVRGWDAVRETMDRAGSQLRDGEGLSFECISTYATAELAYELAIQRFRVKISGADEAVPNALRVTTIFRPKPTAGRSSIGMPIR
jgi:hypothetical protein